MPEDPLSTDDPREAGAAERNVRYYPLYAFTYNVFAWMPIFFLYFSQHDSLAGVLRLEAIYYGAIMALEVPSGYFSDRVGRRQLHGLRHRPSPAGHGARVQFGHGYVLPLRLAGDPRPGR